MPHLRGAEPVEQLDAEPVHPAVVELDGQGLPGGGREPETREILLRGALVRDEVIDHRRHVDEDRRAELRDLLEEAIRGASLGEERGRAADREREQQVRSGGVSEVQLRHGQRHVVLVVAQHALRVALRGVGERAVRLHDGLGLPGRTPGEQPDRRVVAVRGERVELRGRPRPRVVEVRIPDDEQPLEMGGAGRRRLEGPERVPVHDRDGRPRVPVEVLDRLGLELGVHHHDDRADLDRSEERADEVRAVGKGDHHALLRLDAGLPQRVTEPVRESLHLGVGPLALVREEGGAIAAALAHAGVQEPVGDVQPFGRVEGHGAS